MDAHPYRTTADRSPILLGCLGAVLMSALSCLALAALAVAPALTDVVPPPPAPDPARPDITVVVAESYLNRAATDALPTTVPGEAALDVQPGNRLVVTAAFDLELVELQVVIALRLAVEAGMLQVTVESIETAGYDIIDLVDLIGADSSALSAKLSAAIQEQIEAGLGAGAQLLGITTDDEHISITARWALSGGP
jgi:hypothetical protein